MALMGRATHVIQWPAQRAANPRGGANPRKPVVVKGMSQVELAHAIGKDQQSIQRLEMGNVNPTIYYLMQVAEGLDVEINDIVGNI